MIMSIKFVCCAIFVYFFLISFFFYLFVSEFEILAQLKKTSNKRMKNEEREQKKTS